MIRRSSPALALAALVLLVACGGGEGPPPTPASVVAVTANPLANATVGGLAGAASTFEVRAANGRVLGGVPVSVTVTAGGGQLTGAPTTSIKGPTSIGQWTLGNVAGAQSVTVTVAGIAPLVFSVTSVPGAAAAITRVAGHNQAGTGGQPVTTAPSVRVRDQFANDIAGATVNWAVTTGGGTVAAATSLTDASGIAAAPTWTLGAGPDGEQRLTASLNALAAVFSAFTGVVPTTITADVAAPATATVNTALGVAPAFVVRDQGGNAISGVAVTVQVSGGGGGLTGAPTTSGAGATPIGTWTMGTLIGAQSVTVTAGGVAPPLVFTVQATAGPVSSLAVIGGNNQSALAGDLLANAVQARAMDSFGNRVAGSTINWNILTGDGLLSAGQTTADANGESNGPSWRLGRSGGAQEIQLSSNGASASAVATIQTAYRVDLRWGSTPPTGAIADAFTKAVNRIQAMIVGDVSDLPSVTLPASAGCGTPEFPNENVDDIIIYARVDSIDGPGKILGSAGPCFIRATGNPSTIPPITILGSMRFDDDDLPTLAAQGRLEAVILHEMLHVIGIGTLWNQPSNAFLAEQCPPGTGIGINAPNGPCLVNPRFTGPLARAACQGTNGGTNTCAVAVPVENCQDLTVTSCAGGTINSHWKESIFTSELMTGFLSAGTNALSAMTVQSLADMSHVVNLLAADPYTVPAGLQAGALDGSGLAALMMPPPRRPLFTVDPSGRVRPIEYK